MIGISHTDGVIELALGSPPCNEIGSEMLAALESALDTIHQLDGRVLLIHSTLSSGFSAGADLAQLYRGLSERPAEEHEPELRRFLDRIHRVMDTLDMLPLITIGVIHGVCFGGGFELALTCDLRIAEKTARFCFPELRLGILPGFGGIPRLKRELGTSAINDLLLTGRSLNAKKALQLGLVSQMVGRGDGLEVGRKMARQSATFDPVAARTVKAFTKELPVAELAREKELFIELARRPVLIRALKRFVESRDLRPYL